MTRRTNDPIARAVQRFVILPVVLILGIYIVGAFVEALFDVSVAATRIFLGVGGVGFLVYYYRHWIKRIMMR